MRWRRRREWVHRTVLGDAMLASVGGERRTLQGLAAAVWVVLDTPMTVDEIVGELALFGEVPDDLDASVRSALELLAEHGVVEPSR